MKQHVINKNITAVLVIKSQILILKYHNYTFVHIFRIIIIHKLYEKYILNICIYLYLSGIGIVNVEIQMNVTIKSLLSITFHIPDLCSHYNLNNNNNFPASTIYVQSTTKSKASKFTTLNYLQLV